MPVAENPGFPSYADSLERANERVAMANSNEHPAYVACPQCQSELHCVTPALKSTAFEPVQHLKCPDCGWTGTLPTAGGMYF